MNRELMVFSAVMLFGVFISSVAQVLLKKSASEPHGSLLEEYLNPRVVMAYAIYFSATLIDIYAYRFIPLSMGAILESTGYIYVTIFGVVIFKEAMNRQKLMALALILVGIVVYSAFG